MANLKDFAPFVPGGGFSEAPMPLVEVQPGPQSGYAQYLDPPEVVEDAGMGSNGSFLADVEGSISEAIDVSRSMPVPLNPTTGGNGSFVEVGLRDPQANATPSWLSLAKWGMVAYIVYKLIPQSEE